MSKVIDLILSVQNQWRDGDEDIMTYLVQQIELLPVTTLSLKAETTKNPELSKIVTIAQSGWPRTVNENLQPFFVRCDELTIEQGCLMCGARAVIPDKYRQKVLDELHGGHMGVVMMKALARAMCGGLTSTGTLRVQVKAVQDVN